MKKPRTLAIIIVGLWCCLAVNAYDFQSGGIYYEIISTSEKTVRVIYNDDKDYFIGYGNIKIPETVTDDGITYTVTAIGSLGGYDLYDYVPAMTAINIPKTITTIAGNAFYGYTNLKSVTFDGGTGLTIGSSAFSSCSNLSEVYIGSIEEWCGISFSASSSNPLYYAKKLYLNGTLVTNLTIPNNIASLKSYSFINCSDLLSVTIPSSVTKIGNSTFSGCSKLNSVYISNIESWCKISFGNSSSNPLSYADFLYLNDKYVSTLTIPSSLSSVGDYAFCGYIGLTSVTIPENITSIGISAFSGCTNLTAFTVKSTTPPTVNSNAFRNISQGCVLNYPEGCYDNYVSWSEWFTVKAPKLCVDNIYYNITSSEESACTVEVTFQGDAYNSYADEYSGDVVIPETVTYGGKTFTVTAIGLSAFSGCQNLTSVTLPSTITQIDEYGFNYCTSLKSVNLPEGLMTIGPRAFRICHSLTSMEIPATVTTIGESAFYECKALQSVAFKGSVESIGSGAFNLCPALTKVSVDNISDWCGMGFNDLTASPLAVNLVRDANNGVITGNTGTLYVNGEKLTELVVPDDVERINDYAFYAFDELASIDFGKGLKSIGNSAFAWCHNLTSLTIPGNVTSIEREAFWGCQEVSQITIEDSEETLSLGCIGNNTTEGNTSGLFSTCRLSQPLYIGRNLSYAYDFNISPFSLINGYYEKMGTVTFGELVTEIPPYLLYNSGAYVSDVYFQFRSNPIIGTNAFAPDQEIHLALDDTESTDFNAANENTFASAEYNRSLEKGKYGTIMLPFAPNDDNYIFFELTSADGNVLTFDEVEEPKANTPYLFTLREEAEEVGTIKGGQTTIMTDIVGSAANDWQMVGSFTNQTIVTSEDKDKCYYAYTSSDNKIHQVTNTLTVKPYRAYFTTSRSEVAQLAVRTRNGEETLIDAAEVEDLYPEVYYDLSGRRVDNPVKGIYIVNGKKVVF